NAREEVPGVRHARPHFDLHLASRRAQFLGHPDGVVAQNFVAANVDQRGRQPSRVAIERRGVVIARIGAPEVTARAGRIATLSIGSVAAFSFNEGPVSAKSVHGETATSVAGSAIPSSRNL